MNSTLDSATTGSRLRALLVAVASLCLLAVMVPATAATAAPRVDSPQPGIASVPALACTATSTQLLDGCTLGAQTATSLTATVRIVYRWPKDEGYGAANHWFSMYLAGAGWACPGRAGPGSGYYPYSDAPAGSVTCTVTWSWPAGA